MLSNSRVACRQRVRAQTVDLAACLWFTPRHCESPPKFLQAVLAAMKIVDLFPAERVLLGVTVSNRAELLRLLAEKAGALGVVSQKQCYGQVSAREELGSTALGRGIAIPHARIETLSDAAGLLAILNRPIDFEAPDQEPVDVVMMLLLPGTSGGEQIKVLSRVARLARQDEVINSLRSATSPEAVIEILREADDADV